ncbi:MAG: hypothetical protein MJZ35_02690 [Bacteroidaceae bacterium]|nr:hypothetical protein [Bacteroidaceae bacterium]
MSFLDDKEIVDDVDEQIAKSGENRLDYYLLTSGTVTQWKDTAQKRFPNQWEMGPSMQAIGTFPDINNWLYVGEDCFEIEKSGEDDNEIRLVETTDIAWKELESSEKPSLRVSLAQIDPKKQYRIFTAEGKRPALTGDSKVKFLGVFTIDYIECIYRNRMVLRKVSDKLAF